MYKFTYRYLSIYISACLHRERERERERDRKTETEEKKQKYCKKDGKKER